MIKIQSSINVTISKANFETWDFQVSSRRYLIETPIGVHETNHEGLTAALSVLLSGIAGVREANLEEFDSTVNDMLRLWSEGQIIRIKATALPFTYALSIGDQLVVEPSDIYIDVTAAMNRLYR